MSYTPVDHHNAEINKKLHNWNSKPVLQKIYKDFYSLISTYIRPDISGKIVELGSGIGNLKTIIPECITTDLFLNPWIDQVENAYELSFDNNSISHLILFDVLHHLEFPGTALHEFHRVLKKEGRIIIFEPALSILGLIIYGLFHHEHVKLKDSIQLYKPEYLSPKDMNYYAAQGNATRIFFSKKYTNLLSDWKRISTKLISSLSYIASGGYSKPQLLPSSFFPFLYYIDRILNFMPWIFATRLLVILEKK